MLLWTGPQQYLCPVVAITISSPTFHVTAFIRFNVCEPLFAVWAKWVQGIGTGIPDFLKKSNFKLEQLLQNWSPLGVIIWLLSWFLRNRWGDNNHFEHQDLKLLSAYTWYYYMTCNACFWNNWVKAIWGFCCWTPSVSGSTIVHLKGEKSIIYFNIYFSKCRKTTILKCN